MTGSTGEIIENPIKANFKEGLSVFEYLFHTGEEKDFMIQL